MFKKERPGSKGYMKFADKKPYLFAVIILIWFLLCIVGLFLLAAKIFG
jgi:hypothetical protein